MLGSATFWIYILRQFRVQPAPEFKTGFRVARYLRHALNRIASQRRQKLLYIPRLAVRCSGHAPARLPSESHLIYLPVTVIHATTETVYYEALFPKFDLPSCTVCTVDPCYRLSGLEIAEQLGTAGLPGKLTTNTAFNPGFEFFPPPPRRPQDDSFAEFAETHGADEQGVEALRDDPCFNLRQAVLAPTRTEYWHPKGNHYSFEVDWASKRAVEERVNFFVREQAPHFGACIDQFLTGAQGQLLRTNASRLFEKGGVIGLECAAMGGGLTRKLGLNLRADVNADGHGVPLSG
jgi:hypothetical protein